MMMKRHNDLKRAILALACSAALASVPSFASAQSTSFKEDVYPIIEIRCLSCHQPGGEGYEASGFDLRTYEGLMKGTKYGPMVVPGNVMESNLLTMVEGRAEIHMPLGRGLLSSCERLTFRRWVQQGAQDN